jgi:two-component system, cell cycle response regulator
MYASILVIEDNRDNMELADYLLRAYGYKPLLASGGLEAIPIAIEQRPDLILLDVGMPGMDGYDVAVAIRQHPALHGTRIVAVTASAMVGDRERIAAAGFDGYIPKPINPETFIRQIEWFLPAAPVSP